MTENTEIALSGSVALTAAPIFTVETLNQFSENLNSFEESLYQALTLFTKGKIAAAGGFILEAKSDLIKIDSLINSIDILNKPNSNEAFLAITKQIIHELSPVLTHSKILPFAKFACNVKDLGIHTLVTNNLIKVAMSVTPEQLENYDMNRDALKDFQELHGKALEFFKIPAGTEICQELIIIKNDYDSNFQNLSDNLMGVINIILDPISLFASADAVA